MKFLDQLFGRRPDQRNDSQQPATPGRHSGDPGGPPSLNQETDDQAIERYRYLLRTAPPKAIEQAHAEAFAQLTPEQRHLVLEELSKELPPQERTDRDDPQSLARMATRAELRRPGTLERTFGGMSPGGIGLGTFLAYDLLSTIAAVVIGTTIADAIFNDGGYDQGDADGAEAPEGDHNADLTDAGYGSNDVGYDATGDFGGDFAGGEF